MTRRPAALAYGALGLPLAFGALPIYVHVPHYYAAVTGLELSLLGAILLGARLLDAGVDPWLGWLADRLPRRRLLGLALLPFALGFVALLNPPADAPAIWLLAALALTCLGYSAASIAYQAWGADLGGDATGRTRLTAAREGYGLFGVVLAAALPGWLAADPNQGLPWLGWLLLPLLGLCAWLTLRRAAPESRQDASLEGGGNGPGAGGSACASASLWPALGVALANPAFCRLLVVFVANGIAAALPATLFLFFVADVLQAPAAGGALLAAYFIAGAASLPLWVRVAARWGRGGAWLAGTLLAMVAFAGASRLGPGDVAPFAIICLASGLALGADLALPAALAADLGERLGRAGACFGLWNFVAKLNLALAAGLALPLLGWLGYQPGETAADGVAALTLIYALLPLGFKALAAALLWRWRSFLEIRS